jgi:hypothetical protein
MEEIHTRPFAESLPPNACGAVRIMKVVALWRRLVGEGAKIDQAIVTIAGQKEVTGTPEAGDRLAE